MTNLSPAAQAVLDAIQDELDATAEITPRSGSVAAAALRAAADQVVPERLCPESTYFFGRLLKLAWEVDAHHRERLLEIAAELEGQG